MSNRILIVDDTPLNLKLLADKLVHEYYLVSTAENGAQALAKAGMENPDLILLDIMMPDMDGYEVCRRLKSDPKTAHIPVVMVTALSEITDRVRGLEVGADDFLTKPVQMIPLMARVKSLLRFKAIMDEWRARETTTSALKGDEPVLMDGHINLAGSKILLLNDDEGESRGITLTLAAIGVHVKVVKTLQDVMAEGTRDSYDMVLASLDLQNEDALQLCALIRTNEPTKYMPIIFLGMESSMPKIVKGLELGANDYILRPIQAAELVARTRTQIKQKMHYERLRSQYEQNMALALVDPLTGAFNRRYLDAHLPRLFSRYHQNSQAVSVCMMDADHFRKVNNTYGHGAGDIVLKELVRRVMGNLRAFDFVARVGGEEFAVALPNTDLNTAAKIAERMRARIADEGFVINDTLTIPVTISIGVASCAPGQNIDHTMLIELADQALLTAKATGRNKVIIHLEK